jgi:acyl-coenzyme A thioesterase PaaI-like protein
MVFVRSVEPGLLPATASLSVDYHRPAFPPLTFEATLVAQGRSLVFCDVTVTDCEGRLASRGHAVMAVKEMRGDPVAGARWTR